MYKRIALKAIGMLMVFPASVWAAEPVMAAKVKEASYWQPILDMKPEILISIILLVYVTILALVTTYLSISVIRHVYYPVKPGEKHVGVLASAWNNIDAKYISGKYMDETSEGGVREGHVYDGIQELDNFMPPWLQVIMIGTVIFAAVYLLNIFVWGGIDYQKEEYEQEMVQAEIDVNAYLAKAASSIDENSVKLVTDKEAIEAGAKIFASTCKTCHGATAEGAAGPNLKDDVWIHGGKVNEIFKTVKYGVKEKGMPTWQEKLRPIEIQNVAGYILSLKK